MPTVKLIVRCGDGGSYEDCEDIGEVADVLALFGAKPPLERSCRFGFQDHGGYFHMNYISLYRGEWPIPVVAVEDNREITNAELVELNEAIARICKENDV